MGWYSKYMIWFDVLSGKPVAPGSGEDGGPPSIDVYYCYHCEQGQLINWVDDLMVCGVCGTALLSTH